MEVFKINDKTNSTRVFGIGGIFFQKESWNNSIDDLTVLNQKKQNQTA